MPPIRGGDLHFSAWRAACLWTHDRVVACGHSAEIALRLGVAAGGHRIAADHCAGNLSLRCDWPRRVAALPVRVRGLNCCPDVLRLRRGFFLRSSRPDCQRAGCKDQAADSFDLLRHCRSPFARTQDERSDRPVASTHWNAMLQLATRAPAGATWLGSGPLEKGQADERGEPSVRKLRHAHRSRALLYILHG